MLWSPLLDHVRTPTPSPSNLTGLICPWTELALRWGLLSSLLKPTNKLRWVPLDSSILTTAGDKDKLGQDVFACILFLEAKTGACSKDGHLCMDLDSQNCLLSMQRAWVFWTMDLRETGASEAALDMSDISFLCKPIPGTYNSVFCWSVRLTWALLAGSAVLVVLMSLPVHVRGL